MRSKTISHQMALKGCLVQGCPSAWSVTQGSLFFFLFLVKKDDFVIMEKAAL